MMEDRKRLMKEKSQKKEEDDVILIMWKGHVKEHNLWNGRFKLPETCDQVNYITTKY